MDESKFVIDGRDYEVPTLDSFDMDEAQVLFDYAGCVVEDFAPPHPEWSAEEKAKHEEGQLGKVRNPAFKRALVHVAYQRGNPDTHPSRVREVVGKLNIIDVTLTLLGEDDAGPPETTDSQNGHASSEPSRALSRPEDSGSPSSSDSAPPEDIPARTGTSESATSYPASAPTT